MVRSLRPYRALPITTRNLEVIRTADVTPGMRRVTLGGSQLAEHVAANGMPVAAFSSDGFDDEFKLLLKHPDADEAVVPTQGDGRLDWSSDRPEHRVLRTYTVRRWDPVAGELDVDFVQHGVGPATSWARRVQPGERVQIAGPKSAAQHPEGVAWTLVAGDETALPAIGRWLEEWPSGARGQVFIEIEYPEHRQELPTPEGVEVTWLSRDGAEPGTTTLLFDALRAAQWWPGAVFAWVAGEASTLAPIRLWLRREKDLTKEQCEITGYWRRQDVVASADDAEVPDLAASEDVDEVLHELGELLPAIALRVAVSLDLGEVFDGEERSVAELVEATGAQAPGLLKLLRYLCALGVYEQVGADRYRPSAIGRALDDERVGEALDLRRHHAQEELATALALLSAVRPDSEELIASAGAGFAARVQQDPALLASRIESDAGMAGYLGDAVLADPAFADLTTLTVAGRGAVTFAETFVRSGEGRRSTVVVTPSEASAHAALGFSATGVDFEIGSLLHRRPARSDAVLLTSATATLPDEDVVHVLREAAASVAADGTVLLFEDVLDPQVANDHTYEHDLIHFTLYGGGERDAAELAVLIRRAGLTERASGGIGWGYRLIELVPADSAVGADR